MTLFGYRITITKVGDPHTWWKKLAKEGNKIGAIRQYREPRNRSYPDVNDPRRVGLKEAYDVVTKYMDKCKKRATRKHALKHSHVVALFLYFTGVPYNVKVDWNNRLLRGYGPSDSSGYKYPLDLGDDPE